MPTVAIVDGVKIQFFFGDHPPAHFHVDFAGARAQIRLSDFQVIEGGLPAAKLLAVKRWASSAAQRVEIMLGECSRQPEPWEGRVELGQQIVPVTVPAFPVVQVRFADGYEATFDFGARLASLPIMAPLRDPELFAMAHPGSNGGSLEWIGKEGEEIDFCADALRMEAEGIWDPITREWKV